jgi:hypothetical protein
VEYEDDYYQSASDDATGTALCSAMEIYDKSTKSSKSNASSQFYLIWKRNYVVDTRANIDFDFIASHDNLLYVNFFPSFLPRTHFFLFFFCSRIFLSSSHAMTMSSMRSEKDGRGCYAHLLRHPFYSRLKEKRQKVAIEIRTRRRMNEKVGKFTQTNTHHRSEWV